MEIIFSGTDYVLYSKLKVSNVSLNIILCNLSPLFLRTFAQIMGVTSVQL